MSSQPTSSSDDGTFVIRTICIIVVVILSVLWLKQCARDGKEWVVDTAHEVKAFFTPTATTTHPPQAASEYPIEGEGYATKTAKLKCWLDPYKSHTQPSGPARYRSVEDPSRFWDDTAGKEMESKSSAHYQDWLRMPVGRYTVEPLGDEPISFSWWQ